MGNRLSKITTRTGDDGSTGMADGSRLSKADLRFDTMGVVDGLNAHIGLLQAYLTDKSSQIHQELSQVQHKLFNIGGEIALPDHASMGYVAIDKQDVAMLETWIEQHNEKLPYLKEFILPAGSVAIAQTHIARSICRDAERSLIKLSLRDGNINKTTLQYLNRLSDYLFILARIVTRLEEKQEVLWQKSQA